MKKIDYLLFVILACFLFSCQDEMEVVQNEVQQPMKTVVLKSTMVQTDSRASIDSKTGEFSWQSGDLISVLATDGKFYDFTLTEGAGKKEAEFEGSIPENSNITTVATYPRIISNGSENTILSGTTLNYTLPSTWTYAKDVSNVPMVAAFEQDAESVSFKQVGGVMRFPVKNLPPKATFVLTMKDKTITGTFPINISELGNACMQAGTEESVLTIDYSSEFDGVYAEFNVPVPTGTYNNFNVSIKDAEGKVLLSKDYAKDNKVNRATLLNMKELVLPERPMTAEVWPFFVDARAVFTKSEDVTDYAFYVDGADEPVILTAEDLGNGKQCVLFGGTFNHNSTHTVAIAKVVDGKVVIGSKSDEVTFTTANVFALTQNTGSKFVCAGWDDVAIGWGPKYDVTTKKWTAVSKANNPNNVSVHFKRGYQVQLLASDKTTVLYDLIPFGGHDSFTGAFTDSSWLGKVDGQNILVPTALTFGYLEPGKDYYFRVKTLDETVMMDQTNGNYNPEDNGTYPVPYPIYSERGGCAWSQLVKLSTEPVHVATANEILYEGFDDMMVANDYMNWAPAVVPDLEQVRIGWDTYRDVNMKETYPAFLKKSTTERKWTTQVFSETVCISFLGMQETEYEEKDKPMFFNENAGSLKGWSVSGTSEKRSLFPIFGAVRLGQSGSNANGAKLYTPVFSSDKLKDDLGTKCIVTLQVAYCATNKTSIPTNVYISRFRNETQSDPLVYNLSELYPDEFEVVKSEHNNDNNYVHHQRYYEVKHEVYLQNGDKLVFEKVNDKTKLGFLVIGEIKVEVVPGVYEDGVSRNDNGIGTEPDNTNYDIYGLGEFPISYWWTPPTAQTNYDYATTKALYQDVANSGINVVLYNGEIDSSLKENMRIMNICTELDMKFIGQVNGYATNAEKIEAIKNNLATSNTYVGEYIADEPGAGKFDELGEFTKAYMQEIPNKEIYINLFPMYARPDQLGSSSYAEHIDQYLQKIPTKSLSYDYYGLRTNGNADAGYYKNLDLVREKTLEKKMPFWVITQAGQVGPSTKMPTKEDQRWTVWSTIASGSKGIAYFCYWSPWEENNDESMYARMVKRDGTKTDMYYWIQQINADINTIGKKLLPCHADGLISSTTKYYPLYSNDGLGRTKYGPIQKVSAVSENVICGCFRDARIAENGENYKGYKALVVAHQPGRNNITKLTLDPSVTTITVTQNNVSKEIGLNNLTDVTFEGANGIRVTYGADNKLQLEIPAGEAALIEF